MAGSATSRGARAAGQYLAELLQGPYRRRWDQPEIILRARKDNVHRSAIANVLADHLQLHPREGRPQDRDVEPNQLLPLVSRALRGERLSRQTLHLVIDAFRISDEHVATLWSQWEEREPPLVIVGTLPPPNEVPGYRSPDFDTLMLHEHHWLGPDGLPVRHRTQVNIRSRVDGLRTYQYRFDTNRAGVSTPPRQQTEIGSTGPVYHVGGDLYAVDLTFDRPLREGEEAYLEFSTDLRYDEPPPREFRRGTHEQLRDLYLRVHFHERKRPGEVWWAEWQHYQGKENRVIEQERLNLNGRLFVDRRLEVLKQTVVGFYWGW